MGHGNKSDSEWHNKGQEDASRGVYSPPGDITCGAAEVVFDAILGTNRAQEQSSAVEHYNKGQENAKSK